MNIKPLRVLATILVVIAALAFKSSNNGKLECDLQSRDLKGVVTWCKINTTQTRDGKTQNIGEEDFFNADGNIFKEYYSFVPLGRHRKVTNKVLISYDSVGRRIFTDDINNHSKTIQRYHYNADGLLVEELDFGVGSPTVITYNNKGYRDNLVDYAIDGKFNFKTIYKYDEENNNTEITRFWANDVIDTKTIRVFDHANHLLKERNYKGNGEELDSKTFTYDDKGYKIMEVGWRIRELRGSNSWVKTANEQSDIQTYTFKYDKIDDHGNWLQKTTLLNGNRFEEVKRQIVYQK